MEDSAAQPTETPENPVDPSTALAAESAPAEVSTTSSVSPMEEASEPPVPETQAESYPESGSAESSDSPPAEILQPLMEKATSSRLTTEEEGRATDALRALLVGRKEELPLAVAGMLKVGWAASVKAITAGWSEMKATSKSSFLKALAAEENEAGRRIRLSVARGLFKIPDLPACTKLIVGVAKEIRDKETGAISAKDAQSFANVMIGKGKPWIAQLSLAELKPADADLLVHCATLSAFMANLPPITLVGVLRWAGEAGRLGSLHESVSTIVAKSTARWSSKWTAALRREVPSLPELIAASLKPESSDASTKPEMEEAPGDDDGLPSELKAAGSGGGPPAGGEGGDLAQPKQRPVYVSKTIPPKEQKPAAGERPPQQQTQQPSRREGPAARSREFNIVEALRQVDAHITFLKGELKTAESKLRERDEDRRQTRKKAEVPVITGEPTPEELARLNIQLEARILELQARIDDLTGDAEARAVSAGAFSTKPETDPDNQLRTLLGLKLTDVYEDFCALEKEDRDLVVPQHYRTLAAEVFEVLKRERIPLDQPSTE